MMKKRSVLLILLALIVILPIMVPYSASAATYYYVSGTSSLKLREGPTTDSAVRGTYGTDYAVVSYKKYDKDWAYVHFSDGSGGYVMRSYLKASSTSVAYIRRDETSLRSGPAASYGETALLYQGDKVKLLTRGAAWSYISASAGTGYVLNSSLSESFIEKSGNANMPHPAWVTNPNGRPVNVRVGPSTKDAVAYEIDPGTEVLVVHADGSWSEISGPVSGWMMSRYLTEVPPAPMPSPAPGTDSLPTREPAKQKNIRYIDSPDGKSVNVRHGPSEKGYAIVATIADGAQVEVLSIENGWSKITGSGITSGWVKSKFLTSRKPGETPTPKPGETPTPPKEPFLEFKATVYNENNRPVNLREAPGTSYATVTQINPGQQVNVIDESGSWYKITYQNYTGWMKKEFIR